MAKHYREYSHDLGWEAVSDAFRGKWSNRCDVKTYIEEYTGISRQELARAELDNHGNGIPHRMKYEIADELAMHIDDVIDGIMRGEEPEFDPVTTRRRPDRTTGKMRSISYLCIEMQILGHALTIGMMPLMRARILPGQCASIPGRGQVELARYIQRALRRELGIKKAVKLDCTAAYASTKFEDIIRILQKEIPRARWIIAGMRAYARYAPGGHLIIGGFLDAWLFNYILSYAIRDTMDARKTRRGVQRRIVQCCGTQMDDIVLMGRNQTDLRTAIRRIKGYMWDRYRIRVRQTSGIMEIWPTEDEKAHKRRERPAQRGIPSIDIAGYRVSRTRISIRRRNMKKTIRTFDRAWSEKQRRGTLRRQRVGAVIARNGWIRNSDGMRFAEKHHVVELMRSAKPTQKYWARDGRRKREEKLKHAVQQSGEQ